MVNGQTKEYRKDRSVLEKKKEEEKGEGEEGDEEKKRKKKRKEKKKGHKVNKRRSRTMQCHKRH